MKIAIIGLGLIGGSMARRLRGFHSCTIAAYNRTAQTLVAARNDGAIDEGYTEPGDAMKDADLIIMCLYPQLNIDFVRENLSYIKPGALITDVSGIKSYIIEKIFNL